MSNEKMEKRLKYFIENDLEKLIEKFFPLMEKVDLNSICPDTKSKLIEELTRFIYSAGYHQGVNDCIATHREKNPH